MKKIGWLMLFLVCNVSAQIPEAVKQQVDLRIKHQHNPSIALGVFVDGQSAFYVSGWQNQEQQIPATAQTVYEIGSVTKTFTGLLLAILTQEGSVTLDAPVEQYWQQPFKLRDAKDQPITLKQLSTHTSGLPRLPSNLPLFADDPYAAYDREDLIDTLSTIQAGTAGDKYAYSNLAVGLLGETLANIGGHSYNELLQQKIITPLSLQSTYLTLPDVPKEFLAVGYAKDKPTPFWNFKALAGAGSLRSSVTDLLAYGVAYIQQPNDLKAAMNLATQRHYQQGNLQMGLGWHINNGLIWHNGGTGGFRSILIINPQTKKVAAGITNNNQNDVEDLVVHLMDSTQPLRQLDFPVEIDTEQLTEFVGHFQQVNTALQIDIKVMNDNLFFTAPKQPKQAMFYLGNDRFKFKMLDVKITFVRGDNGKIEALTLEGWGQPQTYRKTE